MSRFHKLPSPYQLVILLYLLACNPKHMHRYIQKIYIKLLRCIIWSNSYMGFTLLLPYAQGHILVYYVETFYEKMKK